MDSIKVSSFMKHRFVSFTPQMAIAQAMSKLLVSQQIGGPVLDEHENLIGFLSEQDCMAATLQASYHSQDIATVGDCMHSPALFVRPDDSVLALAEQMLGAKPKLYPVVNDDNRVVGLITRRDVLMAIDSYIVNHFTVM